jgi:hypothetical protein
MNIQLKANILTIIILLIVLQVFQMAIPLLYTFLSFWEHYYLSYSFWAGRLLFGLVIFFLMRHNAALGLPVAALSIVLPVIGGIFYLLCTTKLQAENGH